MEGLRYFNEKYEIESFVNVFLDLIEKGSMMDAVLTMTRKFDIQDRFFRRARTFIMSCFDREDTQDKRETTINFLLKVVRQAEEARLRKLLDPERFQIENVFNHLVQDIIIASRNEKGPGPLSEDDQHWVNRLMFHKNIAGRSLDNFLNRLIGVSK